MSANPIEWRIFYHLSNTKLNEVLSNIHSRMTCGRKIKNRLQSSKPDCIISVHPTMNHTPLKATNNISKELGIHIPFYTVVTDLGSAHCMWFERNVDKIYVASERLYNLARRRGGTSPENIVMTGLPIRHGFAEQSEKLMGGDRSSGQGKEYQTTVRKQLNISTDKQCILIMGGGEGVGSLSQIVNELYAELSLNGVDATICVVCGRNEKLQTELLTRNFDQVTNDILSKRNSPKGRFRLLTKLKRKIFSRRNKNKNDDDGSSSSSASSSSSTDDDSKKKKRGNVDILPLGFLTNIPEYMVAADVLVSKAGPGTIAEAAAVGLPVMMTRYVNVQCK